MASETGATQELLEGLAQVTETRREDWFATFKARHAMQVALAAAARATGRNEAVTQLFTCVTAVDPIVAEGLVPRYADVSPRTLAADPALVHADHATLAVVDQHTFGIIDTEASLRLRDEAHAVGALLMEDAAHCLGRMARDADGNPIADLSIHSFGVEKMLPGVYFGGAVWVNPGLAEPVRAAICAAFEALGEPPAALERAARRYRNQMRVFTRVPHGLSVALRSHAAARGSFEPAVSEAEQRGRVSHAASLPGEWVARQATNGLGTLAANEENRRACVAAYLDGFAAAGADEALGIPAAVREVASDQPLLRVPVFFRSTELASQAIAAVAAQGHYAQAWPRPLLLPGVLDAKAYGLQEGTGAWPVSERLSAGVVGLPTDIDPAAVPAVAQAMVELAR